MIKFAFQIIQNIVSVFTKSKTMYDNTVTSIGVAIDHRKAVRRLIILYISMVWLWLLQIAVRMYIVTGSLDNQYTNLCIAVTTMVGTCYAFYFSGRVKEEISPPEQNNE